MRFIMHIYKISFCVLTVAVACVVTFNYDRSKNDLESDHIQMDSTASITKEYSPPAFFGRNDLILTNNHLNYDLSDIVNDNNNRIGNSNLLNDEHFGSSISGLINPNNKNNVKDPISGQRSFYAFVNNDAINNILAKEQPKPVISRKCLDIKDCMLLNSDNMNINAPVNDESYLRDIRQSSEKVEYQLTMLSDEQAGGDNFVRSKDENKRKHSYDQDDNKNKHVENAILSSKNDDSSKDFANHTKTTSQDLTNNRLASDTKEFVQHKRLFGGGGAVQSRCELDTFSIDMTFRENVELETGDYLLTCQGSVTVNKCEGLCRSHVTPSVNHRDGFVKECACCRDSSTRTRSVTLTTCVLGSNEVVGYSLSRDIIEPTECSCRQCRN